MSLVSRMHPLGASRRGSIESRVGRLFAHVSMALILVVSLALPTMAIAAPVPTWTWQNPLPDGSSLSSVQFVDANTGWAVGDGGTIVKTTDGGASWNSQNSGATTRLSCVQFVDANTGWAVGDGGTIVKTTDGGATWSAQNSGTTNQWLSSVCFVDSNRGWAVGFDYGSGLGSILKTTDGGVTWVPQVSGTTDWLYCVRFVSATTGWAVGDGGTILKTVNGGANWTQQYSGTYAQLDSVSFTDANDGWAVGYDFGGDAGTILKTVNGGATWTEQVSGTAAELDSVSFVDASSGWAVGYDYDADATTILRTVNGGATWTEQDAEIGSALAGVCFIDANHGWAVGEGGTIGTYSLPTAAPVTAISGNRSGWSTTTETITLTPSGGATPVQTFYALGSGAVTTYTAPFAVSTQGTTTVSYRSTDSLGQAEATKTATVQIDSVAPVTSLAGIPASRVSSAPVTLSESALDLGSGVAGSFYSLDGAGVTTYTIPFTVSSVGAHSIAYFSKDNAGNVESASTATLSISAAVVPPTPVTAISGNKGGWSTTTETITLTPSGGAAPVQTFYALGSGAVTTYTAPFTVSTQGTTTVSYRSTDSLGQAEATKTATVQIDSVAPVTSVAGVFSGGSYDGTATASLSASDALSGLGKTLYVLDSVQPTATYTSPLMVNGTGTHTLVYWSFDNAGNQESAHVVTFTIAQVDPPAISTALTIGASPASLKLPKPFVLSGLLSGPSEDGLQVSVWVKKSEFKFEVQR